MGETMNALVTQMIEKKDASTVLQRIAEKDQTAVKDCIDVYGNFIWTLAKKFTRSREQAAIATEEIFTDIWRYCGECRPGDLPNEGKIIELIALRRLIKFRRQNEQTLAANIETTEKNKTQERTGFQNAFGDSVRYSHL